MPKYTVKSQPSGLLNGYPWPEVGQPVDLSDEVAEGMVAAGHLEKKDAAKKPAKKAEKKTEKKTETATASKSSTETRKGK